MPDAQPSPILLNRTFDDFDELAGDGFDTSDDGATYETLYGPAVESGAPLTAYGFSVGLGRFGNLIVVISVFLFGISTDPRFGPMLAFGLGGRYVEVFADVRFGVPPLSVTEARAMVRGIRGFPLLEGVRGEQAADLDTLIEVLLRIAQLSQHHPQIAELDINPFLASASREAALALDVRIRVSNSQG